MEPKLTSLRAENYLGHMKTNKERPKTWEKETRDSDGTTSRMTVKELPYNKKVVYLVCESRYNYSGEGEDVSIDYISDTNPLAEKKSFLQKLSQMTGIDE